MDDTATFSFHDSLNDFLQYSQRNVPIIYTFRNEPAIKDSIEAIGVPHPEVAYIIVNNESVDFSYRLKNLDRVLIYPYKSSTGLSRFKSIKRDTVSKKFILDVHLGKLAKALRLLGFDTLYQNDYADGTIVNLAQNENRIVLTRDIGLLKHKAIVWGYWLRSQHLQQQLAEVIRYFNLSSAIKPFSRCLACNYLIELVEKEAVLDKLPPGTIQYFNQFYQCTFCKRIYWKGSHYENMMRFIEKFTSNINNSY